MSDSETFLSRWLRLKRRSEVALPPADASPPTAFDPASLPSIESIVADTDVQLFLREGVPAELTRAALRTAWTADPAIRDFVGIAENQWNFNDQACIPGFGPLGAADYLVDRALGSLTNVAAETPQGAEDAQLQAPQGSEPLEAVEALEAVEPAAMLPVTDKADVAEAATREGDLAGGETSSVAVAPRSHGGALPQ
jgi:Protein of unknown function (DUF3306)